MKSRVILSIITMLILSPFLLNLSGWSIYAYFNFGKKDLILASGQGVSHNAWAEHFEKDDMILQFMQDKIITIVDYKGINIYLERNEGAMTPYTFKLIKPDKYLDYSGVEFPWLMFLIIPLIMLLMKMKLIKMPNKSQ